MNFTRRKYYDEKKFVCSDYGRVLRHVLYVASSGLLKD